MIFLDLTNSKINRLAQKKIFRGKIMEINKKDDIEKDREIMNINNFLTKMKNKTNKIPSNNYKIDELDEESQQIGNGISKLETDCLENMMRCFDLILKFMYELDTDSKIPVFGFGCKLPPLFESVNNNFSLKLDMLNPDMNYKSFIECIFIIK
jgi:hypothetical protein